MGRFMLPARLTIRARATLFVVFLNKPSNYCLFVEAAIKTCGMPTTLWCGLPYQKVRQNFRHPKRYVESLGHYLPSLAGVTRPDHSSPLPSRIKTKKKQNVKVVVMVQ